MPRKTEEIDLNTATEEELSRVRTIGPEKARQILEYREENGPFEDWSDLLQVEGFDENMVDNLEKSGQFILGTEEEEEGEGEEW